MIEVKHNEQILKYVGLFRHYVIAWTMIEKFWLFIIHGWCIQNIDQFNCNDSLSFPVELPLKHLQYSVWVTCGRE